MAITKPISYYKFQGNATDIIRDVTGTVYGSVIDNGKIAYSYYHDGINDSIGTTQLSGVRTINMWIKPVGGINSSTDQSRLLEQRDSSGFYFLIEGTSRTNSGALHVLDDEGSVSKHAYSEDLTWTMDEWYMITFVCDGASSKFYRNGVLLSNDSNAITDTTLSSTSTGTTDLVFARDSNHTSGTAFGFNGNIADTGLFDAALTQTEITELYNSGTGLTWSKGADDFIDETDLRFGLLNYYGFDIDSTDYLRVNDGTDYGTPTKVTGKVDSSIDLDGSGDYVDFGNTPVFTNSSGNISWGGWFKRHATKYSAIIAVRDLAASNPVQMFMSIDNSLKFRSSIYGSPTNVSVSSSTSVVNNIWYHVVFTWDGIDLKIYLNGVEENSSACVTTTDSTTGNTTRIGRNSNGSTSQDFNGEADEVFIYNKALSTTEISDMYNSGTGTSYNPSLDLFIDGDSDSVTYRIEDDFNRPDSTTLGVASNGNTWVDGGTAVIKDDTFYNNGSTLQTNKLVLSNNIPERVNFKLIPGVSATGTCYIQLFNTTSANETVYTRFTQSTNLYEYYDGSYHTIATLTDGTEHDIEFRNIDYTAYTYDIFVDDVEEVSGASFRGSLTSVDEFRFLTQGVVTMDDVTTGVPYNAPAPGTEAFDAIFFGANF